MPTTCEVIGLWPCFHATIRLLRRHSREHVFVVLQEATTSIFFFCHIARMQATSIGMTTAIVFFMLYRNEQVTMIHFLHRIARE